MAPQSPSLRAQPIERQARTAWRNGGGETRELCAWPEGAGLEAFEWRVSVATVARDGPFSRFPGVMRTAVLLDGAGVRLSAGNERVELARPFAQAAFAGEIQWECVLMEGPVQLLNVMVRGSSASVALAREAPLVVRPARFRVVYAARGMSRVGVGAQALHLAEGDSCSILFDPAVAQVHPAPQAIALIASIEPAGTA